MSRDRYERKHRWTNPLRREQALADVVQRAEELASAGIGDIWDVLFLDAATKESLKEGTSEH